MKKYEIIQQALREQIRNGSYQPGDRLPSESFLCAHYDVSRNVVRQALRNLEAEGFTETLKGIGTFCRSRERSLSKTIGFISFFTQEYIFANIISSVDTSIYPQGFQLVLGQSLYDLQREGQLLERFRNIGVDGIIMEPVYGGTIARSNAALIAQIISSGIPVIFIDNAIPQVETVSITLNDYKAGQEAARYLSTLGHNRIALFYQEDYLTKVKRKEGAEDYLDYQPKLYPFQGQGAKSNARERAVQMIDEFNGEYSAVFCSSDQDAMHLIESADRRGIAIPENLSLIGFDNQQFSGHNRIRLTTFAHPSKKVGRLAASNILDALYHPDAPTHTSIIIDAEMIERDSVADLTT